MSPFFPTGPKKPPPQHGIKMKKAGSTWWGQRWIAALEHVLRADAGRLARGRTYARAGRTHDLTVLAGKVSAKVTGSRAQPYEITLALAPLSDAQWQRAIAGMVEQAQFSAELLAGRMPQTIDEVFLAAQTSLFPRQRSDLTTTCSCPDWGDPCKHVAATHYVLGEALDRDPFLLFELRGRTQSQVLDALRAARAGSAAVQAPEPEALVSEIPKVAWSEPDARAYDEPTAPLPALQFSFTASVVPGAMLRQLGAPSTWSGSASPADALAPLLAAAAEAARRIALSDPPAVPEPGPEPEAPRPPKPKRSSSRPRSR